MQVRVCVCVCVYVHACRYWCIRGGRSGGEAAEVGKSKTSQQSTVCTTCAEYEGLLDQIHRRQSLVSFVELTECRRDLQAWNVHANPHAREGGCGATVKLRSRWAAPRCSSRYRRRSCPRAHTSVWSVPGKNSEKISVLSCTIKSLHTRITFENFCQVAAAQGGDRVISDLYRT